MLKRAFACCFAQFVKIETTGAPLLYGIEEHRDHLVLIVSFIRRPISSSARMSKVSARCTVQNQFSDSSTLCSPKSSIACLSDRLAACTIGSSARRLRMCVFIDMNLRITSSSRFIQTGCCIAERAIGGIVCSLMSARVHDVRPHSCAALHPTPGWRACYTHRANPIKLLFSDRME